MNWRRVFPGAVLLVTGLTLLIAGCNNSVSGPGEDDGTAYYPMQTGNSWLLSYTSDFSTDSIATRISKYKRHKYYSAYQVMDLNYQEGEEHLRELYYLRTSHDTVFSSIHVSSDSLGNPIYSEWRVQYVLNPDSVGMEFPSSGIYPGTYRFRIEDSRMTVETPAGTFDDCIFLHEEYVDWRQGAEVWPLTDLYFARGTGLVKRVVYPFRVPPTDPGYQEKTYLLLEKWIH